MAVHGLTVRECVEEFGVSIHMLDKAVSEEHVKEISKFWDWRTVAPQLIGDKEVERIDLDEKNEERKQYMALQKWRRKFAFKATYLKLIKAFLESDRGDHAAEVCQLLARVMLKRGVYKIAALYSIMC